MERTGEAPLSGWALSAALIAALELTLLLLARTLAADGLCLPGGELFSCAPLLRPALGRLGPVSVIQVGALGAGVTAALALLQLFTAPGPRRRELAAILIPAAGAGFALGLQVLPVRVEGALCLICVGVLGCAFAAAGLLVEGARRRGARPVVPAAAAFALALAATAAFGAWRGGALAERDAAARAAVLAARGPAGPELVLVTRPGCPFCRALLLDVLADDELLERLGRTRGLTLAPPEDPRARAHAGEGTPVLLAFSPDGQLLGRHRGFAPVGAVARWLDAVLAKG